MKSLLALLKIREDEARPVAWSAMFFFCLLCGWYLIRPLREAMGISRNVRDLPYLYLFTLGGTLIATPLFGMLVMRFRRQTFIAIVYRIFMFSLLGFVVAMHLLPPAHHLHTGYVFYVWVSIFNMFLVTLFWGFMADNFKFADSKRIFGLISVGGSLGAITGSTLTTQIAEFAKHRADPRLFVLLANLILAIVLFEAAIRCMHRLGEVIDTSHGVDETAKALAEYAPQTEPNGSRSDIGKQGGAFAGIRQTLTSPYLLMVCAYLFLYTATSTFLYFFQANIVSTHVTGHAERTQAFATIDFWVNVFTLAAELFITSRLLTKLGVSITLLVVPVITILGFVGLAVVPNTNIGTLLGMQPALAVLIIVQVLRRGGWYGIGKPAKETLFTVLSREAKYKAKSFIDTFVYRGGDAITASTFGVLTGIGFGLTTMAGIAITLGSCWAIVGIFLGSRQKIMAQGRRQNASGFPVIVPPA